MRVWSACLHIDVYVCMYICQYIYVVFVCVRVYQSACACVTRTYIIRASQGFGDFVRGALLPFSVTVLASTYEEGEEEGERVRERIRGRVRGREGEREEVCEERRGEK